MSSVFCQNCTQDFTVKSPQIKTMGMNVGYRVCQIQWHSNS